MTLTPSQIEQGTKTIAEYDGWFQDLETFKNNGDINWIHKVKSSNFGTGLFIPRRLSGFKYHTSLDWLNPCWKKVYDQLGEMTMFSATNFYYAYHRALDQHDIPSAFLVVVETIKLINGQSGK